MGVQRGELENTRPLGDTVAPFNMACSEAATRINSIKLVPSFPHDF